MRDGSSPEHPRWRPGLIHLYIGLLAGLAISASIVASGKTGDPWLVDEPLVLTGFMMLLVLAERLFVRFRYAGEVNSLNLVEAIIAPMLLAFPAAVVVTAVGGAQVVAAITRRNAPVKAAFNIVQWSLMAATGAALVGPTPGPLTSRTVYELLGAMAVMGLVNHVAFTGALAIANKQGLRRVISGVVPVIVPGWVIGWSVNVLVGLLFVFAYETSPVAVVLFPVPLFVLHLAYRGYAGARSDRVRLSGLHSAARVLARPLDPQDAFGPFLREVALAFEARAASLVLKSRGKLALHALASTAPGAEVATTTIEAGSGALEDLLSIQHEPIRVERAGSSRLSELLAERGARDCMAAPLIDEEQVIGALIVYDQASFEGFEEGELAVIAAFGRETAGTITKGRLLAEIIEERRRFAEIVTSTSDGIFTLDSEGRVRSWNRAMEKITGLVAADVVGLPGGLRALAPRAANGEAIDLGAWRGSTLPREVRITSAEGVRRLWCSYSTNAGGGDPNRLVVIARDMTTADEMEALRRQFGRLAEAEAAQRVVVEQLQQAVMPARPAIAGAEFGVSYLSSDPSAPTGGDLYDWHVMPSGQIHVAVIDVLGHGVSATKDALSIVHALRTLALQDTPPDELILKADALLTAQSPGLAATAIVARFDPPSGKVLLAAGGHPPALHVHEHGVTQVALPGGAIGWPGAGSRGAAEIRLQPGESLILYTDGLVEAHRDIIAGTSRLMEDAAASRDLPAQEMAATLMRSGMAGADRRDDSVVMVLRRFPADRVSWLVRAEAGPHLSKQRALAREWLTERDVPSRLVDDVLIVMSELMANAVAAAHGSVTIGLEMHGTTLRVDVRDDGPGMMLSIPTGEKPSVMSESGRGMYIVQQLSDDVSQAYCRDGTMIRAAWSIQPAS